MKNSVARIIHYSILVVLLLIALVAGLLMYIFRNQKNAHLPQITQAMADTSVRHFDAHEIRNLDIDWASGAITLEFGDTQELVLTESGTVPMSVKLDGNKLNVKFPQDSLGLSLNNGKDLHILVPQDWECQKFTLDCASASLQVLNGTIQEVEIHSASGTSSFQDCALKSLDIDTASGNVAFDGTLNEFECNAASANVSLHIHNCPTNVEMKTTSGDLTLYLPTDCGFLANHQTISGEFHSELFVTTRANQSIRGDGACKIDFEGLSASLTIRDGKETVHHSEEEAHHNGAETHK